MSNGLDPDQDQHFVGPDLGPSCLQKLSVDDKGRHYQGKFWTVAQIAINLAGNLSLT